MVMQEEYILPQTHSIRVLDDHWTKRIVKFQFESIALQTHPCNENRFFPVRKTSQGTSHSAYVATSTESDGVKFDGLLPPNFF